MLDRRLILDKLSRLIDRNDWLINMSDLVGQTGLPRSNSVEDIVVGIVSEFTYEPL